MATQRSKPAFAAFAAGFAAAEGQDAATCLKETSKAPGPPSKQLSATGISHGLSSHPAAAASSLGVLGLPPPPEESAVDLDSARQRKRPLKRAGHSANSRYDGGPAKRRPASRAEEAHSSISDAGYILDTSGLPLHGPPPPPPRGGVSTEHFHDQISPNVGLFVIGGGRLGNPAQMRQASRLWHMNRSRFGGRAVSGLAHRYHTDASGRVVAVQVGKQGGSAFTPSSSVAEMFANARSASRRAPAAELQAHSQRYWHTSQQQQLLSDARGGSELPLHMPLHYKRAAAMVPKTDPPQETAASHGAGSDPSALRLSTSRSFLPLDPPSLEQGSEATRGAPLRTVQSLPLPTSRQPWESWSTWLARTRAAHARQEATASHPDPGSCNVRRLSLRCMEAALAHLRPGGDEPGAAAASAAPALWLSPLLRLQDPDALTALDIACALKQAIRHADTGRGAKALAAAAQAAADLCSGPVASAASARHALDMRSAWLLLTVEHVCAGERCTVVPDGLLDRPPVSAAECVEAAGKCLSTGCVLPDLALQQLLRAAEAAAADGNAVSDFHVLDWLVETVGFASECLQAWHARACSPSSVASPATQGEVTHFEMQWRLAAWTHAALCNVGRGSTAQALIASWWDTSFGQSALTGTLPLSARLPRLRLQEGSVIGGVTAVMGRYLQEYAAAPLQVGHPCEAPGYYSWLQSHSAHQAADAGRARGSKRWDRARSEPQGASGAWGMVLALPCDRHDSTLWEKAWLSRLRAMGAQSRPEASRPGRVQEVSNVLPAEPASTEEVFSTLHRHRISTVVQSEMGQHGTSGAYLSALLKLRGEDGSGDKVESAEAVQDALSGTEAPPLHRAAAARALASLEGECCGLGSTAADEELVRVLLPRPVHGEALVELGRRLASAPWQAMQWQSPSLAQRALLSSSQRQRVLAMLSLVEPNGQLALLQRVGQHLAGVQAPAGAKLKALKPLGLACISDAPPAQAPELWAAYLDAMLEVSLAGGSSQPPDVRKWYSALGKVLSSETSQESPTALFILASTARRLCLAGLWRSLQVEKQRCIEGIPLLREMWDKVPAAGIGLQNPIDKLREHVQAECAAGAAEGGYNCQAAAGAVGLATLDHRMMEVWRCICAMLLESGCRPASLQARQLVDLSMSCMTRAPGNAGVGLDIAIGAVALTSSLPSWGASRAVQLSCQAAFAWQGNPTIQSQCFGVLLRCMLEQPEMSSDPLAPTPAMWQAAVLRQIHSAGEPSLPVGIFAAAQFAMSREVLFPWGLQCMQAGGSAPPSQGAQATTSRAAWALSLPSRSEGKSRQRRKRLALDAILHSPCCLVTWAVAPLLLACTGLLSVDDALALLARAGATGFSVPREALAVLRDKEQCKE